MWEGEIKRGERCGRTEEERGKRREEKGGRKRKSGENEWKELPSQALI